jgi:hypothetical protein
MAELVESQIAKIAITARIAIIEKPIGLIAARYRNRQLPIKITYS